MYQQENSAGPYTFNVDNLEKSKFDYAFKVFGYAAETEHGSKIAEFKTLSRFRMCLSMSFTFLRLLLRLIA